MEKCSENLYQAIYFDWGANIDERIVLIDETFEYPAVDIGVLKSVRLKDMPAIVVGGNNIQVFRKRLEELDKKHSLGKHKMEKVIALIFKLCNKLKLKVVYKQNC